jgi:hypothetical protein
LDHIVQRHYLSKTINGFNYYHSAQLITRAYFFSLDPGVDL